MPDLIHLMNNLVIIITQQIYRANDIFSRPAFDNGGVVDQDDPLPG